MSYSLAGVVPIGGIYAWLKSFTNTPSLPDEYVEANGQTLSDAQSIYNGVVLPNLNTGTQRFIRGSSTSGTTGSSDTHTHGLGGITNGSDTEPFTITCFYTVTPFYLVASASNLPNYYEVVYIIRIK